MIGLLMNGLGAGKAFRMEASATALGRRLWMAVQVFRICVNETRYSRMSSMTIRS